MVTFKEFNDADDYTVFEEKTSKRRITKYFLRQNLIQVQKYMINEYKAANEQTHWKQVLTMPW